VIDALWFWSLIVFFSAVLIVWLIFSIYRGIRHEVFLVVGFIFLVIALSVPETAGSYLGLDYYVLISIVLASIGIASIVLGVLSSGRRWVTRRGTEKLNKFTNLLIFAYLRHPITLGCILISFAIIFLISSIVSNVLAIVSILSFVLSSFERDVFLQKAYGYPYRLYMKKVPRFNILHGILRSILAREKEISP
jgi:protein-S-isoprenylcysteine O-methyltransferase Ste14